MFRKSLKLLLCTPVICVSLLLGACAHENTEAKMDPSVGHDVWMLMDALPIENFELETAIGSVKVLHQYDLGTFVSVDTLTEEVAREVIPWFENQDPTIIFAKITDSRGTNLYAGFRKDGLVTLIYPSDGGPGMEIFYERTFT